MISIEVGSALPSAHPLACCVGPAQLLTATFSHPHNLNRRLARGHTDKQDGTPVTPLDVLMQRIYWRQVHRAHPDAKFLGEESLPTNDSLLLQFGTIYASYAKAGKEYVVDPVDGTSNLGVDWAGINTLVGFCNKNQIVGGLMCQPGVPLNGIVVGHVGHGAQILNTEARVTKVLTTPVVPTTIGRQSVYVRSPNYMEASSSDERLDFQRAMRLFELVKNHGKGFDSENEAAALRYFIMGRLHVVVLPPITGETGRPKIWDVAAGLGIAASLGARLTDWEGRPLTIRTATQGTVASFPNNPIHDYILDTLSEGWRKRLPTPDDRTP